ncbi:hypothetical protein [Kribbella sp. NPDC023855]|uniref:hypothetical protein n=1 Tax=Kribbella sp. NPDC023855 TaxID=3154698 RepID=UPI0033F23DF9
MPDPELVLVPTELEDPKAGGAAATASPATGHAPTCPLVCCTNAHDEAVTGVPAPLTAEEFDAIVGAIWADLDDDPMRIGDLLATAVAFIAGIALHEDTDPQDAARAAAVLREMEQRALWGPDHEHEDHR